MAPSAFSIRKTVPTKVYNRPENPSPFRPFLTHRTVFLTNLFSDRCGARRELGVDYICITDIAKQKNDEDPNGIIGNWLRNRNTIEFLGIWESLYNPSFNPIEFEGFRKEAGLNAFTMSPTKWVESTNAIGIMAMSGRYGGTYAISDIAFEFASWVSVEFKLYLVREFQRLKAEEQKQLSWSAKRELSKINYRIHTDAIKTNLIPAEVTREQNPEKKGNIRDYATINELICLSNMENLNAVFINDGIPQSERLIKLNQIAIQQMKILEDTGGRNLLK